MTHRLNNGTSQPAPIPVDLHHSRARAKAPRLVALSLLALSLVILVGAPAAADLHVTYFFEEQNRDEVRAGTIPFTNGTATPLSITQDIQYDVLKGTDLPARWSTGTHVVRAFAGPPFRVPKTVYFNGEIIGCDVPIEGEDCSPPSDDLIDYGEDPPLVTNSITLRFANATEEGGLAGIGPGDVEIVDLNWQNQLRTGTNLDSFIVVGGNTSYQVSGSTGTLGEDGQVRNWSTPLSGDYHTHVLCTGAACSSGLDQPGECFTRHELPYTTTALADGDLIIVHGPVTHDDEIPIEISEVGDDPATCLGLVDEFGNCPEGKTEVPASIDMTFTNGYQDVAFEMFSRCTGTPGDHRVYYHFEGAEAVIVPEPTGLLFQAGALALVGVIVRRRRMADTNGA